MCIRISLLNVPKILKKAPSAPGAPLPFYIRTSYPSNPEKAPVTVSLEEYMSTEATYEGPQRNGGQLPWYPFQTRTDFEFAKLTLDAKLNRSQVTKLLTIFQRCERKEDALTFKDYRKLEETWTAASHLVTPFQPHSIPVTYKDKTYTFDYWERPLWAWASDLVQNKALKDQWQWDAKINERYDGHEWVRFIDEPWTADRFAHIQASLPAGATPLCIILYADKTQLSSFGTAKGHPVYAKIANLPAHIRNGNGIGGGRVVGWLPIVDDHPDAVKNKGNTDYADFKAEVWHACLQRSLEVLREASDIGHTIICGDDISRWLFPLILILSSDYEEQAIMAAIRGLWSTHPCPKCLILRNDQSKYFEPHELELRSGEASQNIFTKAFGQPTKAAREAELKTVSLRPVKNAFWTLKNTDPHTALGFDPMHNYAGGLAKAHILELILHDYTDKNLKKLKRVKDHKALIEPRAAKFPRWRGLIHFNAILSETSFQDSNHWEDMARILMFVLHPEWNETDRPEQRQLLRCLRSFLRLNVYVSLEVHTKATIMALTAELKAFFEEIQKYSILNPNKGWNFPKMHAQLHLPDEILDKGSTKATSTKTFEWMHGPIKDTYLLTNFKNIASQILGADHNSYVVQSIQTSIELFDKASSQRDTEEEGLNQPKYRSGHLVLRSADNAGRPIPVSTFNFDGAIQEEQVSQYPFSFLEALSQFSNANSNTLGFNLVQNTCILPFKRVDTSYQSLVTWKMERDIVRCSREFHGHPRYDYVMMKTTLGTVFARLLYLFVIFPKSTVSDGIPLAVVLPYHAAIPPKSIEKDADLGFYRVRLSAQPQPQIVHAHSLIRGALLVPAFDQDSDLIVFDILDADMFMRMEGLCNSRFTKK
ncbi:hypothetical protein FA15DRAFT_635076 [Coprinopsis marcescibilis]|uniref:Uncharacterized protein n=1 Tax=Coprinopsis marcescibilis TaxID=230819 RepID=A0A5C3L450_COPMA|nr:hypothetical protein FA15DRAFT_635076 [Coprinopsis marcescibilis]